MPQRNDARFLFLCRQFVDTGLLSYDELGRIYGTEIYDQNSKSTGQFKPLTRQAIRQRRLRLEPKFKLELI